MNKEAFKESFEKASVYLNEGYFNSTIDNALEHMAPFNGLKKTRTAIIIAEELGELMHEVQKYVRGEGNYMNLLEEYADVKIVMAYLDTIVNIDKKDISKAINVKLDRINHVIRKEGELR